MRIKIIGDNNCARATRHLLRLAGFAVTEFLPADAVTQGPLAGYAITIDLAPATPTPDASLRPDPPTQHPHASNSEEAPRMHRDASSPSFTKESAGPGSPGADFQRTHFESIRFDSVDSAIEAAVLRHVTQLAAAPVIVDRPGGVVHSDRELRIVAPNTGDAKVDEAAAVAIEFGVLRGLLDLTAPAAFRKTRGTGLGKGLLNGDAGDASGEGSETFQSSGAKKKWWPFAVVLILVGLGALRGLGAGAPGRGGVDAGGRKTVGVESIAVFTKGHRLKPTLHEPTLHKPKFVGIAVGKKSYRLKPVLLGAMAQGQFADGQGTRITDGTNYLVVDPCKGQTKFFASISQTGNTQLVPGTASKKIYVCSIHVVAAAATNVAVVEGTGAVCGTGTAGVSGFGGATAATGWNFAANGGIALGNGDSSLGAEGTSGDNLCVFNSGAGQVSGGMSYVVQ